MTHQHVSRTNQQSKSDTPLVSGILQRAAVRNAPEKDVQPTEEVEATTFKESRFHHNFSQVPASTGEMPRIQPKLKIGAVGDRYEQEADKVAQNVVQRINAPEHKDEVMRKTEEETLQREEMPEDEEELRMKPEVQRLSAEGEMAAPADLESSIQGAKGGGQPLVENVREPMEQAFGVDFSGVRVHADAKSDALNQSIQAKAFTTGQDVFFRSGVYAPGSRGGQELLAHELTHVVQQSGSVTHKALGKSIQRKPQNKGEEGWSDDELEVSLTLISEKENEKKLFEVQNINGTIRFFYNFTENNYENENQQVIESSDLKKLIETSKKKKELTPEKSSEEEQQPIEEKSKSEEEQQPIEEKSKSEEEQQPIEEKRPDVKVSKDIERDLGEEVTEKRKQRAILTESSSQDLLDSSEEEIQQSEKQDEAENSVEAADKAKKRYEEFATKITELKSLWINAYKQKNKEKMGSLDENIQKLEEQAIEALADEEKSINTYLQQKDPGASDRKQVRYQGVTSILFAIVSLGVLIYSMTLMFGSSNKGEESQGVEYPSDTTQSSFQGMSDLLAQLVTSNGTIVINGTLTTIAELRNLNATQLATYANTLLSIGQNILDEIKGIQGVTPLLFVGALTASLKTLVDAYGAWLNWQSPTPRQLTRHKELAARRENVRLIKEQRRMAADQQALERTQSMMSVQ